MSKKMSKKTVKTVMLCLTLTLLLLVAITIGVGALYYDSYLSRLTLGDQSVSLTDAEIARILGGDDYSAEELSGSDVLDSQEIEDLHEEVKDASINEDGLLSQEGVTNILLLGLDTRDIGSVRGRTDSMMILTLNDNTGEICISSLMRDSFVSIPGVGGSRLNAAFVYGGADLAVTTVESNFGIEIDKYVLINFYAFIDIVDKLGGLKIDINEDERLVMNDYITEVNTILGRDLDYGKLESPGQGLNLTGLQAMGYVRNRYSGNADYMRTQRQRTAIMGIIDKLKNADLVTIMGVVDVASNNMRTNYDNNELTTLALNAANYADYSIKQLRVPADNTYSGGIVNGQWILQIDFAENRRLLREAIFPKLSADEGEEQ